jgi:hypothetical protein
MKILCSMNKMQRSFLGTLGKKLSVQVAPTPVPVAKKVVVETPVQEAEVVTEVVSVVSIPVAEPVAEPTPESSEE